MIYVMILCIFVILVFIKDFPSEPSILEKMKSIFFIFTFFILLIVVATSYYEESKMIEKYNNYLEKINLNPNDTKLLNNFFDFTVNNYFTPSRTTYFDEETEEAFEYFSVSLMLMYRAYIIRTNLSEKKFVLESLKKQLNNIHSEINSLEEIPVVYEEKPTIKDLIFDIYGGYTNVYYQLPNLDYFCGLVKLEYKYRRLINKKIIYTSYLIRYINSKEELNITTSLRTDYCINKYNK